MRIGYRSITTGMALIFTCCGTYAARATDTPLFKDFMGINGHSVQTDSDDFKDVVSQMRDYHPVNWDLLSKGTTASWEQYNQWAPLPPVMAENGVNWQNIYSAWSADGFTTNTSLLFSNLGPNQWANMTTDAFNYANLLAGYYGPNATGAGQGLIDSLQLGNEPGNYNDLQFRQLYQALATGARAADPGLKLVTSASQAGASSQYSKTLNVWKGIVSGQYADLTPLVDAYAVHAYAQIEPYPTWRRTFPEDTAFNGSYLGRIQDVIDWRDANDPTAEVWITEFGYDAYDGTGTPPSPFEQWEDVTMLQQAQWLTRSWLVFSGMDIEKAYMYFFEDGSNPGLHSSSGLRRSNNTPKPSYFATEHLQETLGDYRFSEKILEVANALYIYEYERGDDPSDLVWAVWLPTGEDEDTVSKLLQVTLNNLPGDVVSVERLALTSAGGTAVAYTQPTATSINLQLSESVTFIRFNEFLQLLLGDANNDGVVDAADFLAVESNLGSVGADDGFLLGDANDDGRVDGSDWIAVEKYFGASLGSPAVPEPATGVLMLGLAIAGTLRRRTHRAV